MMKSQFFETLANILFDTCVAGTNLEIGFDQCPIGGETVLNVIDDKNRCFKFIQESFNNCKLKAAESCRIRQQVPPLFF